MTSRFENEADETHTSVPVEDETSVENEDESDQAKASHLPKISFSLCVLPSVSDVVAIFMLHSTTWKAMKNTT